jgi:NAD-dependent dihydropyrimidine dehydrogenase PreA subunit
VSFVIAEPCIDVLDQACMRVCPVACIHFEAGQDRKLSIDPEECIDCGPCEPACPVEAIYDAYTLPTTWQPYATIDALWYRDPASARAQVAVLHESGGGQPSVPR